MWSWDTGWRRKSAVDASHGRCRPSSATGQRSIRIRDPSGTSAGVTVRQNIMSEST